MNYEEFLNEAKETLTGLLSEDYPGISITPVDGKKLQNSSYRGLSVREEGHSVAMTMDLKPLFDQVQEGDSKELVLGSFAREIREHLEDMPVFDIGEISNYDVMKENLSIQMISIRGNEHMLSSVPHKVIHNLLFDVDGHITDASMKRAIIEDIKTYVHKGLAKKVTSLLDALKIMCSVNEMPIQEDRIHFKNGTYFIDEDRFIPDKEFCINRLPVAYNPEAPKPDRWLKFLGELLYEEDIPTLQEFMGYTMIPTTRAQKMLIVIGKKDYQPVAGTEGYDWRRTIILQKRWIL